MRGQEIFVLKMPQENIFELAKKTIKEHAKGKEIEIKLIGAREREKTTERLFTNEEKEIMIEKELFYIIPSKKNYYQKKAL